MVTVAILINGHGVGGFTVVCHELTGADVVKTLSIERRILAAYGGYDE